MKGEKKLFKNFVNEPANSHRKFTFSAPERSSFLKFINIELTRNYVLEYDEEQYSAVRKKLYLFMKIPREVEKFMLYGFFQVNELRLLHVFDFAKIDVTQYTIN